MERGREREREREGERVRERERERDKERQRRRHRERERGRGREGEGEGERGRETQSLNHPSVHQWGRSAIHASQQPTSPIGFLSLKLPSHYGSYFILIEAAHILSLDTARKIP